MKNDLYIYVQNDLAQWNVLEHIMFADLIDGETKAVVIREKSEDRIADILARRKLQRFFAKPINLLLHGRYELGKILQEKASVYKRVYVLFTNTAFTTVRYPAEVLKYYQKKWSNVKFILYYPDAVCRGVSDYANYLREAKVFDLVYSFDAEDAEKYGMIFWRTPYSAKEEYRKIVANEDAYFVGVGTDRFSILCDVARCGKKAGLKMHLDIIHKLNPKTMQNVPSNVLIHSFENIIPYGESLKRTLNAKCILDVVRPEQAGLTLRAYEAVVYNRKLLTNNKSIFLFPFYDPRFMQYFEKVEDIDWDWVKEDIEVDYHYNGEFSPLRLLEDIIKSCEEK